MLYIHNVVAVTDVLHVLNSLMAAVQLTVQREDEEVVVRVCHAHPDHTSVLLVRIVVRCDDEDETLGSVGICIEDLLGHLAKCERNEMVRMCLKRIDGTTSLFVNDNMIRTVIVPSGRVTAPCCGRKPRAVSVEDALRHAKENSGRDEFDMELMQAFISSLPQDTSLVESMHGDFCCASHLLGWAFLADAGAFNTSITICHEMSAPAALLIPTPVCVNL